MLLFFCALFFILPISAMDMAYQPSKPIAGYSHGYGKCFCCRNDLLQLKWPSRYQLCETDKNVHVFHTSCLLHKSECPICFRSFGWRDFSGLSKSLGQLIFNSQNKNTKKWFKKKNDNNDNSNGILHPLATCYYFKNLERFQGKATIFKVPGMA